MEQWIEEWTSTANPTKMSSAYFHAIRDQIYRNGNGLGIEPAIISGSTTGTVSYCDRTYAEATSQAGGDCGIKISIVYGTPSY